MSFVALHSAFVIQHSSISIQHSHEHHVLFAVFRRNFVSYFANPTGYIFICVFVLLGAIAAFCRRRFFNTNLANLDQLNNNPYLNFFTIMLVFIPAITMGIWADERQQGTDELLLTIPASDFDIVLGKYLAAVAIFTVSLLFSLVCNYVVLNNLASTGCVFGSQPATRSGLFLGTYAGYWLVGLAMLAIGMVASFLTGNLTIAFVLGVLFNVPLVLLFRGRRIIGAFSQRAARALKHWSIGGQFHDFSRGMLSLAGRRLFPHDSRGHALREHGAHRAAALVQRLAAMVAGRPFLGARPGAGRHRRRARCVRPPPPRSALRRHQREAQLALAANAAS